MQNYWPCARFTPTGTGEDLHWHNSVPAGAGAPRGWFNPGEASSNITTAFPTDFYLRSVRACLVVAALERQWISTLIILPGLIPTFGSVLAGWESPDRAKKCAPSMACSRWTFCYKESIVSIQPVIFNHAPGINFPLNLIKHNWFDTEILSVIVVCEHCN